MMRARTGWNNFTRNVRGWFGVGKFIAKDTTGTEGVALQKEGQVRLDAATQAFENLKKNTPNDPERRIEELQAYTKKVKKWFQKAGKAAGTLTDEEAGKTVKERAAVAAGDEFTDQLGEKLKELTGCDLELINKILSGDVKDIAEDIVKGVKNQLYTLPAQTVHVLAKEIRKASFANAVHLYIQERESNKSPEEIFALMESGNLPELDFVTSIKGVATMYAKSALLVAYEEAYQRYRLANSLSK